MNKSIEQQVEEIRVAFPCIDSSCDQNGCIPHQVAEEEWEAQQCEFCYKIRFPMLEEAEKILQERDRIAREDALKVVKSIAASEKNYWKGIRETL